jgi:hypothetical protein
VTGKDEPDDVIELTPSPSSTYSFVAQRPTLLFERNAHV